MELSIKSNIIFIIFVMISCGSDSSTEPEDKYLSSNLITNSSFEFDNSSSVEGWNVISTNAIQFKADHPTDGGRWSVYLDVNNLASLTYKLAPEPAEYIYELSIWSKAGLDRGNHPVAGGEGWLELSQEFAESLFKSKKILIDESADWKKYTILDTINSTYCDNIFVSFGFSPNGYMGYGIYFDLCSLYTLK